MTLEEELETAVTAAGRHARPGEQPVAVMAAEPAGTRVFVVALAAGEDLGFVAVDRAGTAVADRRLVKDAVYKSEARQLQLPVRKAAELVDGLILFLQQLIPPDSGEPESPL